MEPGEPARKILFGHPQGQKWRGRSKMRNQDVVVLWLVTLEFN